VDELEFFEELLGADVARTLHDWQQGQDTHLAFMQELTLGFTDAPVFVAFERPNGIPPRKLIVKVCPPEDGNDGGLREPGRHLKAQRYKPAFADNHLVEMVYEPIRAPSGAWITFQALAGVSGELTPPLTVPFRQLLDRAQPPCSATELAEACGMVVRSVLEDWPVHGGGPVPAPTSVVGYLDVILQGRHHAGGSVDRWVSGWRPHLLDPACRHIEVDGRACPNPLALALDTRLTAGRSVVALYGPAHGDLHPGNILVPVRDVPRGPVKVLKLATYWLIDLARFELEWPLASDPVHLALSIAGLALGRLEADEQHALLRYVIDPDDESSGDVLPHWVRLTVPAVMQATPDWIEQSFAQEWREQTLLALVAWGLAFAARRSTDDAHRDWYFRLAAHAGREYLDATDPDLGRAGRGPLLRPPTGPAGPVDARLRPPTHPEGPARRRAPSPPATTTGPLDDADPGAEPADPLVEGRIETGVEAGVDETAGGADPDADQGGAAATAPAEGTTTAEPAGRADRAGTSRRRRPLAPQLVRAGDELARRVREQWRAAADEQRLVHPAPVPVRWERAPYPLPRDIGPTGVVLRQGGLRDLFPLYYSLRAGDGRLLVTGAPGAGKTTAAILLALDVLEYRANLDHPADRMGLAVPVILTAHDWDPRRQSVESWMAQRIATDYPLLGSRRRARQAAHDLIRDRRIALFLDGLDEMAPRTHELALQGLRRVHFPVVVVSRSAEPGAVAAATPATLSSAIAVELRPVDPATAADFLARCHGDDAPPPGWPELVAHVREHPGGPLAEALDTPLMLGLLRDTYGTAGAEPTGDRAAPGVADLLDAGLPSRQAVEHHLLGQVVSAAYAASGRSATGAAPSYTREQAQHWLTSFAHMMGRGDTHDLAWWRLPEVLPWWRRWLVTSLLTGLSPAAIFGLVGSFGGHPVRGLLGGLLFGPLAATFDVVTASYGQRRTPWGGIALGYGLTGPLTGALAGALLMGTAGGTATGLVAGTAVGGASGLAAAWEAAHRLGARGRPSSGPDPAVSPEDGWHEDARQSRRFGALLGATVGATLGLVSWRAGEPLIEVAASTLLALAFMPFAVIMLSPRTKTRLAALQLALDGRSPVRVVRFLEDARRRSILRAVGPVYQFRHARLQDVLARSWPVRPERRAGRDRLRVRVARPRSQVRVSFAALLRVKDDDGYVLVATSTRPGCFGPPGGVFKHRPGAAGGLDGMGFREERHPSHRDAMRFDLRGLLPAGSLRAFGRWFATGAGRETAEECLRRALAESLGGQLGDDGGLVRNLVFVPFRTVVEGPTRVAGKDFRQVRRCEVYGLDLTDPVSARFRARLLALAADPAVGGVLVATSADIEAAWSDGRQVVPQSAYLIGDRKLHPDVPLMP
jgi:hypothetical protein